jgi:hypothetical protein
MPSIVRNDSRILRCHLGAILYGAHQILLYGRRRRHAAFLLNQRTIFASPSVNRCKPSRAVSAVNDP